MGDLKYLCEQPGTRPGPEQDSRSDSQAASGGKIQESLAGDGQDQLEPNPLTQRDQLESRLRSEIAPKNSGPSPAPDRSTMQMMGPRARKSAQYTGPGPGLARPFCTISGRLFATHRSSPGPDAHPPEPSPRVPSGGPCCENLPYVTQWCFRAGNRSSRAGFRPDSNRESLKIGPPAGRRPAGGPV